MASPAVAVPNGLSPGPVQASSDAANGAEVDNALAASSVSSITASSKRKREDTDVGPAHANGASDADANMVASVSTKTANGVQPTTTKIDKSTIRDYFHVLER
jgi:hypothetical protein